MAKDGRKPGSGQVKVPTVHQLDPATGKRTPVTKERIPLVRVPTAQIVNAKGEVDGKVLAHVLEQIQDNFHDATIVHRSSPLNNHAIIPQVTLQAGKGLGQTTAQAISHGLGAAFTGFSCLRVYPYYTDTHGKQQQSLPFQAQETINNTDAKGTVQDPSQYLCLISAVGGMYDILVYA